MAKLYYGPDYGTISVREDDDKPSGNEIEITAEQASALGLSSIARALDNLYTALENGLPGPK